MFTNLPLSVELGLIVATLLSAIMIYFEKKFSIFKIIGVFIASVLLFMSIFSLGNNIYKIVAYPTYKATIVHVDTREKKDEDGYTYLMYQPTYTFNNGEKEIKVKSTMSTSGKLEIGAKRKIAYKNGEFLEYTEGTLILIIALLIGLSITFFILFILMGMAFNKEFKIEKYLLLLFRIVASLFLLLMLFGILQKFWFIYWGEEELSNMDMFVLVVFLFLVLLGLKAMQTIDSTYVKKNIEIDKHKKSSKKEEKDSLEDLNPFDSNIIALVAILFFATIFSIIAFVKYLDDGVDMFVVIFGLIGIGGAMFSFYFYLSYLYFKKLSFKLYTPLTKGVTLKGRFLLKRNIQRSTMFMVSLVNTHKVLTLEEGKYKYRTKVLWEREEVSSVERGVEGFKIPFSLSSKNYHKGKLELKIKAKLKWFTFVRSYTLDEK